MNDRNKTKRYISMDPDNQLKMTLSSNVPLNLK